VQEPIRLFRGEYFFLSNFFISPVTYEGLTYRSVEHAYHAAKTTDPKIRERFTGNLTTPSWAKQAGRALKLRDDWETLKLNVMWQLLNQKFAPGTPLADRLVATADAELIEENHWGDTFWGVCNGVGLNNLGRLLMGVRGNLVVWLILNMKTTGVLAN